MSPDTALWMIIGAIVGTSLGTLVGLYAGMRFGPIRWIYRDPPTLQEVWQKAYNAMLYRWKDLPDFRLAGLDRLTQKAREAGDAAVASAKKTKCWQCGALPVFPEESKP